MAYTATAPPPRLFGIPAGPLFLLRDYAILARPRLIAFAAFTTTGGYAIQTTTLHLGSVLLPVIGVCLIAAAASAAKQVLEIDIDAAMRRTRNRPLPAGRISTTHAQWFMGALLLAGTALLLFASISAALLCLAGFALLVFAYTPLKRRTLAALYIGAIAGATPTLAGAISATGQVTATGISIFAFVFIWQIPYLLAGGWVHREDYSDAKLRVLAAEDPEGLASGETAVLFCTLLLALCTSSYTPFALFSPTETRAACVAAGLLLVLALRFFFARSKSTARVLSIGSVLLLLCMMGMVTTTRLSL